MHGSPDVTLPLPGMIRSETAQRAELDEISSRLVEAGVGLWAGGNSSEDAVLVMRGQSNLLDDIQAGEELETIGSCLTSWRRAKTRCACLMRWARATGSTIGAENKLFTNTDARW